MTSPADLCNEALSEIGARATITDLLQPTQEAINCNIWYDRLRKALLRTAPWGFCRTTAQLTQLGAVTNTPPDNIYPWAYKYLFPADCIKFRYILPPPPSLTGANVVPPETGFPLLTSPWAMPNRNARYVVSTEMVQLIDGITQPRKVILTNQPTAYGVYSGDISDPDMFDEGFHQALVAALESKLIMPLTGDASMKKDFEQMAQLRIAEARAADGNEAIPSTDHTPDWIMARGLLTLGQPWDSAGGLIIPTMAGYYTCTWDDMHWGM